MLDTNEGDLLAGISWPERQRSDPEGVPCAYGAQLGHNYVKCLCLGDLHTEQMWHRAAQSIPVRLHYLLLMNMAVNPNILYLQNFLASPGLSGVKFCLTETSLRERSLMEEGSLCMEEMCSLLLLACS